jgi:ABC-2 type transport system permease protein
MALVAPIMMLLIFGYAVNTDVNHVDLVVCDESRTPESRELIEKFNNSYYFKAFEMVESTEQVEEYIDKGIVKVGLVIPTDYAREIKRGQTAEIQILVDGSDPTIARTAMSYSVILANNHTIKLRELQGKKALLAASAATAVSAKPLVMYNPTLESSKFNVPGVVGLILQNITIILTAFAMVRERERGTIEQLIMTPVTSLELIVGKLIPYIVIGFYDFIIILGLSYIMFGVAIKGSLLLLILLGSVFLIGALAMGMLISAVAKSQLQAMQAAMLFILPSVLLSGFMFPREAMPKLIYAISCAFPITYFLEILRGIIVKGVGLNYLAGVTTILMLQIAVIIVVTMKKFKKTLD